jgi:hypothetical protein
MPRKEKRKGRKRLEKGPKEKLAIRITATTNTTEV